MSGWSKRYAAPAEFRFSWWQPLQWHGYDIAFSGWESPIARTDLLALPEVPEIDSVNVKWDRSFTLTGRLSHPQTKCQDFISTSWTDDPEDVSSELIMCSTMVHCILIASGLIPEPIQESDDEIFHGRDLHVCHVDSASLADVPAIVADRTGARVDEVQAFSGAFGDHMQSCLPYFALRIRKGLGAALLLSGAGIDLESGNRVDWLGCTNWRSLLRTRSDNELVVAVVESLFDAGAAPFRTVGGFPSTWVRW